MVGNATDMQFLKTSSGIYMHRKGGDRSFRCRWGKPQERPAKKLLPELIKDTIQGPALHGGILHSSIHQSNFGGRSYRVGRNCMFQVKGRGEGLGELFCRPAANIGTFLSSKVPAQQAPQCFITTMPS